MCLGLACCGCQQICGECCECCKTSLAPTMKQQVRMTYFTLFALFGGLSIVILYFAQIILEPFEDFIECPASSGGKLFCLGVSGVYRISLALASLFLLCLLASTCKNSFSKAVNEGCWFFKVLLVVGLFILYLFINNTFFEGYIQFARVVGAIYLLFQIIMLIDIFYLWGERWITAYNDGQRAYGFLLIGCTGILYTAIIILLIYNFIWFSGSLQVFVAVAQIILVVIMTGITISGIAVNGSLITSSSISLYTTYLVWSGLANSPSTSNNTLLETDAGMITDLIIGALLIIVSIGYYSVANEKFIGNKIIEQNSEDDEPLNGIVSGDREDRESQRIIEKDLDMYKSNQMLMFHFIMVVASIYYTLLMTNWGSPRFDTKTIAGFQPSETIFWIKIVFSWVSSLLYIWTLVAPRILRNRNFQST